MSLLIFPINNQIILLDLPALINLDVNTAIEMFYDKISKRINAHVPLIQVRNTNYPIWFNHSLIKLSKLKCKAWTQYQSCPHSDIYYSIRRIVNRE